MMDEIPVELRRNYVTDIDSFLSSEGGVYFLDSLKVEYKDCVEALIDADITAEYTPLTREGFIGDIRRLKATINNLQVLRDELVASIKDHELEKETDA
jgi:hypothetical protein